MGPVLFLLYINDVTSVINSTSLHLYADDTVLYHASEDPVILFSNLQKKLNDLVAWCTMNKLTLNTKKTKAMLFFPTAKCSLLPDFLVHECALATVGSYKYLGYYLDSFLRFDKMMQTLINTVTYKLYLLAKLRPMLTRASAAAVYKSKILSYVDYSSVFQLSVKSTYKSKLQALQNHAIRLILKLPRRTNVDQEHAQLGIWHLENRRNYFLMKLMHLLINNPQLSLADNRGLQTRAHGGLLLLPVLAHVKLPVNDYVLNRF